VTCWNRNATDKFWRRSALCLTNGAHVRSEQQDTAEHLQNRTSLVPQSK